MSTDASTSTPTGLCAKGPEREVMVMAQPRSRMSIAEIARRLAIGERAVYQMLEQGILPGIRLGKRWLVTRHAFESWEKTCGLRSGPGLPTPPEVTGY